MNKNKSRTEVITSRQPSLRLCMLVLACLSASAQAIESLSEDDLGHISAGDGLVLDVNTPVTGISASELNVKLDTATATEAGTLSLSGVTLRAVDTSGNLTAIPVHSKLVLDVGSSAVSANNATLGAEFTLDRARLSISNLRTDTASTRSFGTSILDASGKIALRNTGVFDGGRTDAYLLGQLNDAVLFYQPLWSGHPYLTMNKLNALWEIQGGTIAVTPQGIKMTTIGTSSPLINVKLDFDILYKFPAHYPGEEYIVTANDRPLMHFGWLGSLKNAELIWQPGGSWTAFNTATKSQGLFFSSKWDFVSHADAISAPISDATKEFRWQLGEAAAGGADRSRVNFELSDWATWAPSVNANAHSFPLIAIDVINSASTTWNGQLCWGASQNIATCASGGQAINLAVGNIVGYDAAINRTSEKAISLLARKGQLMSFSRRINVLETNAAGTTTATPYNWGLIYTLANVDANIYLYPGGSEGDVAGGSRNRGIIADIMLMSQSLGAGCNANPEASSCLQAFNWDKGTHFMIADTDVNKNGTTGEQRDAMGIGLVSSSFLMLSNDTRIWLKQMKNDTTTQVGVSDDPYLSGVDLLSRQARVNIKGTFGGGILPPESPAKGQELIKGGFINMNFEGMMNFRMSTASTSAVDGKNFLGYSAALRLMDTNVANFSAETTGAADSLQNSTTNDDGSFFSISEPSNASADLRLANISGDMALTEGRIDLRGSTEAGGNGKPQLKISNTILIGAAAAGRMNDAVIGTTLPAFASGSSTAGRQLDIGRVEFGNQKLGRIVIPTAQMYSSITLKPQ